MNSLFSRTIIRFSSCNLTSKTIHNKNFELRFGYGLCYFSTKTASVGKSKIRKSVAPPAAAAEIMITEEEEEEKNGFFVVRKGDLVGVYNNLIDCQAQVGSSVCDLPVSVYKGYTMSKESEAYLVSRGLKGALYTIRAIDLREGLFGNIVPCPFQNPPERRVLGSQSAGACFLEFDGACKGNPGPSGAGAVLRTADGTLFYRLREGLGTATNNVAEYRAMILGLRYALSKGFTSIHVVGDSKLVCMQIQGLWRVRHENMIKWYEEAKKLKDEFLFFQINHVLRANNSEADAQANLAVVLAAGEVQEEEVNTGKTQTQTQQSMGLHTSAQVSSSYAHNF